MVSISWVTHTQKWFSKQFPLQRILAGEKKTTTPESPNFPPDTLVWGPNPYMLTHSCPAPAGMALKGNEESAGGGGPEPEWRFDRRARSPAPRSWPALLRRRRLPARRRPRRAAWQVALRSAVKMGIRGHGPFGFSAGCSDCTLVGFLTGGWAGLVCLGSPPAPKARE